MRYGLADLGAEARLQGFDMADSGSFEAFERGFHVPDPLEQMSDYEPCDDDQNDYEEAHLG